MISKFASSARNWMSFDYWITYISLFAIMLALIYSIWAYWWSVTYTRFKWVQTLILLCLLSNLISAFADTHDLWAGWNAWSEGIATFIDVGGYYGFQNSIYWLFGFKYWVIAKEVPDIINE